MLEEINYRHAKFQINSRLELRQLWLKKKENSEYNSVVITTLTKLNTIITWIFGGQHLAERPWQGCPG